MELSEREKKILKEMNIDYENMTEDKLEEALIEKQNLQEEESEVLNDDLMSYYEPIKLNDDQLTDLVNTEDFIEGSKIGAKFLGIYTILINGGIPIKSCTDILLNQQTLEHNYKLQLAINKTNVEMSKNKSLILKGQEL